MTQRPVLYYLLRELTERTVCSITDDICRCAQYADGTLSASGEGGDHNDTHATALVRSSSRGTTGAGRQPGAFWPAHAGQGHWSGAEGATTGLGRHRPAGSAAP